MEPIIVKLSTEFNTTAKNLKDKFNEYQENIKLKPLFIIQKLPWFGLLEDVLITLTN